jgi:sugar (pentulose or hexulose) kinase
MSGGWTIVLDIGKTLSKATLWSEAGHLVASRSRPNSLCHSDGYPCLDAQAIEAWLEFVLGEFAAFGPVDAIVPVAHGAAVALVLDDRLECAPMDYEWQGEGSDRQEYDEQRDPFALTGSPALPAGLNLGVQLHRLERLRKRSAGKILPWAQYWSWRLSGVMASELTSLGCHTDLWRPYERRHSGLAVRRGWAERLAPLMPARATLGFLHRHWATATGLPANVEIACGLHDSNAALMDTRDHPDSRGRDVTVLSTGTWFVAMRSPAFEDPLAPAQLPPHRDCLVNVDHRGLPIPSSRFMGGREIEILAGHEGRTAGATSSPAAQLEAAVKVIEAGHMILPTAVPQVGPFPARQQEIIGTADSALESMARAHIYAALVADVSLDLIGARDCIIVEGRFSQSRVFVRMLRSLRPETRVLTSDGDNGVARGALRLIEKEVPCARLDQAAPLPIDVAGYRAMWRQRASAGGTSS